MCQATGCEVTVSLTADGKLWMCNRSDKTVKTGPGELFGFGLGFFEEKSLSTLAALIVSAKWLRVHKASGLGSCAAAY